MSAVAASGLVVRFDAVAAVDGVSLEIERGEVFGLLGPNGAGKTTTLRVLTTLLRPDAGSALVAGYDVGSDAQAVRASIGYVPQAPVGRRRADGGREPRLLRSRDRSAAARARRADRFGGRGDGARADARPPRAHALRRHAAAAGDRHRAPEPARGVVPRRADGRAGPDRAGAGVGARARAARRRGDDRRRHDAPDGGGRAPLRPAGDHGRRPGRRARNTLGVARASRRPLIGSGLPGRHRPRARRKGRISDVRAQRRVARRLG